MPADDSFAAALTWVDDETLVVRGTTFEARAFRAGETAPDHLFLMKPRPMVERYVEVLTGLAPRCVIELGVFRGGSTAFLAHLLQPSKLLAVDLSPARVPALDAFIDHHGYQDTVSVHFGVDQSDRVALRGLVDAHLGDQAPDLIIDDASHMLGPTRDSFNALFPILRPGGLYLIEDWAHGLFAFSPGNDDGSLSVLAFELLMAMPYRSGMIDEITVNPHWVAIRKGAHAVGDDFDLADERNPSGQALVERLTR